MVIDTSEIKVGWKMNTVIGTFERLYLLIGYKEGKMYRLTMLSCPVFRGEEKVDKNSLNERFNLFCCLPHLSYDQ